MQKNILITGINRGLGKALFELFASNGYFVFGVVRNELNVAELQKQFPKNSQIILADVSSDECIEQIQKTVQGKPIDLLINNAGIPGKSHLIQDIDSSEIMELFNVHCMGIFRTTKALESNLLKADKPIILNLNSRLGSITRQANRSYDHLISSYSYRIAKASQNMLTNCLRIEFKNRIEIISLHPGRMKTASAHSDADVDPNEVATTLLHHYENGQLKEENGIQQHEKEVIEW